MIRPRREAAPLENLTRRAGRLALRESRQMTAILMRLFEQALHETRASVPPELEEEYRHIAERLRSESPGGPRRVGFAFDREPGEVPSQARESAG